VRFYSKEVMQQVRKHRENGASIKALAKEFGISYPTIRKWVYDIQSESTPFKNARIKDQQRKERFKPLVDAFSLDSKSAKLLVSLLYWCEGSKPPVTQSLQFANSDPRLVRTFIALLRYGFSIEESRVRAHLQIHETQDYAELLRFWSTLLSIPPSQFHKPTITKPQQKMKRRDYLGTCTIRYHDVALLLSITGIYEALAQKWEWDWRGSP
jgi:hypothetical protein